MENRTHTILDLSLFKSHDVKVGELKLEEEYTKYFRCPLNYDVKNPLADPDLMESWVNYLHKRNNIYISYGGYMETRKFLLKNQYMKENETLHLGVDITLPPDVPIFCPAKSKYSFIYQDTDQKGGWGGVVVLKLENEMFVIFAHLAKMDIKQPDPYNFVANRYLGRIGFKDNNGNWWPHLHIQACREKPDFDKIDGYGLVEDEKKLRYYHPEPLSFLGINTQ